MLKIPEFKTLISLSRQNNKEHKVDMLVKDRGDHYEVLVQHVIHIGKAQPLENFKQYLEDQFKEFDKELTTTLYQVVTSEVSS